MRKSFEAQIEGLEKQLNEEINQKLAAETMLKGSEIRLGKFLKRMLISRRISYLSVLMHYIRVTIKIVDGIS